MQPDASPSTITASPTTGGRHEGLESAQRKIDTLQACNDRQYVTLTDRSTEISTLKTHLEVEKRRTEELRYSAQREINYLQERLHDYRNSYGPNARSYSSSFDAGYRYSGSCLPADGGTVFPYNASRATIEVTRDYFQMLQAKVRKTDELQLRVSSFESFKSAIRTALGAEPGTDTVGVALSVKAVSVYNAKQQELLNELQAKNKWQTNEINKLSSVVIEQQPAFKRLERENEDLRTVLRQSNKWAQRQSARITKANTFFASIKAEANSAFNYNGTFLGFDAAQRALRSILSITTKLDTDASSNSV